MTDKTIFLVDDDSDLLEAMQRRCESIGLKVRTARNLLTAMSMVEESVPDLFCIDVNMPTGNGLEFCQFLASEVKTKKIPVIVLTGESDAETVRKCGQLRAHYVHKSPNMWRAVEPLVRGLLDMKTDVSANKGQWFARNDGAESSMPHMTFEALEEADDAPATKMVVIADDDPDIVDVLTRRFSGLGCSVIGTRSACDALNVISRTVPDLVCLDVNMPAGNGLSVCEMMSDDEFLSNIPVIILTGQSDPETIKRCHDMMAYYVEKNVNVWQRVEPIAKELLAAVPANC